MPTSHGSISQPSCALASTVRCASCALRSSHISRSAINCLPEVISYVVVYCFVPICYIKKKIVTDQAPGRYRLYSKEAGGARGRLLESGATLAAAGLSNLDKIWIEANPEFDERRRATPATKPPPPAGARPPPPSGRPAQSLLLGVSRCVLIIFFFVLY
jgi:hypothetical protein